ncbi:hypothetical protein CEXT_408231 [Caerostris extrusa]|uniref:Uncharacterized protein n=1 Tax=Caerostris extrusa TaxID=172846 RepID=A0AAV4NFW9_CAEEX|nr:hypothetical protein CEXT_408231 [Caerostris extrusa]
MKCNYPRQQPPTFPLMNASPYQLIREGFISICCFCKDGPPLLHLESSRPFNRIVVYPTEMVHSHLTVTLCGGISGCLCCSDGLGSEECLLDILDVLGGDAGVLVRHVNCRHVTSPSAFGFFRDLLLIVVLGVLHVHLLLHQDHGDGALVTTGAIGPFLCGALHARGRLVGALLMFSTCECVRCFLR